MSNSPVPSNTLGPDTWISRFTDCWFCRAAPTPSARMCEPSALRAFALGIAGVTAVVEATLV